jgi:hypothetical protein
MRSSIYISVVMQAVISLNLKVISQCPSGMIGSH